MRVILLILILVFYLTQGNGQDCKPNTNIKVTVCGVSMLHPDSMICVLCPGCRPGLRVSDSRFSIISYKLRWDAMAMHIIAPEEILNSGADFNEAKTILDTLKPGVFLEFSCIKAKDINGNIHILQPLVIVVK